MRLEEGTRILTLCDFYGGLLTDGQRRAVALYYGEDMTLAEAAAEMGISRQGVHDALKKARTALENYERKLGLAAKFKAAEVAMDFVKSALDGLISESGEHGELAGRLRAVRDVIEDLEV